MVAPPGVAADADLEDWFAHALRYVEALPPKEAKPGKQRTA